MAKRKGFKSTGGKPGSGSGSKISGGGKRKSSVMKELGLSGGFGWESILKKMLK